MVFLLPPEEKTQFSQYFDIICGDPARGPDRFAFVGIRLLHREIHFRNWFKINVRLAKQYHRQPFWDVAEDMLPLLLKVNPVYFGLETNNMGEGAIDAFSRLGYSDIRRITTVPAMNEINREKNWERMDKPYTVQWLVDCCHKRHSEKPALIQFPQKPSATMRVLIEQILMIQEYKTPSGFTGYKAMSSRHDDLFMAFLMCCHVARHIMLPYKAQEAPTLESLR